jgi:hypothetical protein
MVDLTDDQKVQIEIDLIKLQAKNVITDDQLGALLALCLTLNGLRKTKQLLGRY